MRLLPVALLLVGDATAASLRAAPEQPAPAAQPTPAPQRAKLDVGFGDFEKNLTMAVTSAIKANLTGASWTDDLKSRVIENVTGSLHSALQDALKPVKLSIGKTWMALPEDDQKNTYVNQLRGSFESVMERARDSLVTHLSIGLRHASGLPRGHRQSTGNATQEMLEGAEQALVSGLLVEHCYDEMLKHPMKAGENGTAAPKETKFCIPSAVSSFVKRLNDTQGLVSMTMRFEAHAMALAQQEKKAVARRSA
mmetsp:Transcript_45782/g.106120  ORF Transcript_45782/g.106120 Transcript_45782/m.106120 type:complete len:252 (-) Transcript_45782:11-766(-)